MSRQRRWIGAAALCVAMLVAGGHPPAAQFEGGRSTYGIPALTEAGDWEGTWFHVERDKKAAVWIRHEKNQKPVIRVQFFSNLGDETFTTGWDSHAEYQAKGTTGYFTMTILDGDENRIEAEWDWKLEFPDSGRVETSRVSIYRTGDGRGLAFHFEDWTQSIRRGAHVQTIESPHVWTFRKISRRELIWDELPL